MGSLRGSDQERLPESRPQGCKKDARSQMFNLALPHSHGLVTENEIQASGQPLHSGKISLRPNLVRDNEVGAASRRQFHFQANDWEAGIFFHCPKVVPTPGCHFPQRAHDCEGVQDRICAFAHQFYSPGVCVNAFSLVIPCAVLPVNSSSRALASGQLESGG